MKYGLVKLHMQDDVLRHHWLEMFSKVSEAVQDVARARVSVGGVAPMQIGAVKGRVRMARTSGAKVKARPCQLKRRKMTHPNLAEASVCKEKCCVKSDYRIHWRDLSNSKDSGEPFVDRKQTSAITDDKISSVVIEVSPAWLAAVTTSCFP